METFKAFNPLDVKSTATTEAATRAIKREIENILESYVGWFDPFAEVIQNSLDSLEERLISEGPNYTPTLWILINVKDQYLSVTDNGVGLDKSQFESFLAPDFSFKSGEESRGHKGVGATYLAYGFNYIQVGTKTTYFSALGRMINARDWVFNMAAADSPKMEVENSPPFDERFNDVDQGVTIGIKFGNHTRPKDLGWMKVKDAQYWFIMLCVKTGLGAIYSNDKIKIHLRVIDETGETTTLEHTGIEFYWPHKASTKTASIEEIKARRDDLYKKGKDPNILPGKLTNLEVIYQKWDFDDLKKSKLLTEDEQEIFQNYYPIIYGDFVYSTKFWDSFHDRIGIRSNIRLLYGGIQMASNNMPQGELIQIPLKRYTGRQNQAHFVIHFKNLNPDLGRKGYQSDIVRLAASICSKLVDTFSSYQKFLRPTTGAPADILREETVEQWKEDMKKHEATNPLKLQSDHFFLPMKTIAITSEPTREQDVIALFNQLLAGGVIRGIRIMSTNERFTYDGMYKILLTDPTENHLYDKDKNPLGIDKNNLGKHKDIPFISSPRILEYKFSLDGLIEDINSRDKNSNEIGLVVVWETGEEWKENYKITSLLDTDNLNLRQYHGITHVMTNLTTGQKEMDLIVLKELIDFLNDPIKTIPAQVTKYEDY